jgi:hypothetical protein
MMCGTSTVYCTCNVKSKHERNNVSHAVKAFTMDRDVYLWQCGETESFGVRLLWQPLITNEYKAAVFSQDSAERC